MNAHSYAKISRRGLLLISGTALLAACSTSGLTRVNTRNTSDRTVESLAKVNALRATRGLPPLVADSAAIDAARYQAARMAQADRMSHLIGMGDSFLDRMKGGKVTLPAAENIATGQETAEAAVQAWIDSPKHLANMLGSYRGLGVALARDPASKNRAYWAMVLSG